MTIELKAFPVERCVNDLNYKVCKAAEMTKSFRCLFYHEHGCTLTGDRLRKYGDCIDIEPSKNCPMWKD